MAKWLADRPKEFAALPEEAVETLALEVDLSSDLEYLMAIAQTRPELELAATSFLVVPFAGALKNAWEPDIIKKIHWNVPNLYVNGRE